MTKFLKPNLKKSKRKVDKYRVTSHIIMKNQFFSKEATI